MSACFEHVNLWRDGSQANLIKRNVGRQVLLRPAEDDDTTVDELAPLHIRDHPDYGIVIRVRVGHVAPPLQKSLMPPAVFP